MNTINIQELNTPEAIIMKYIAKRIGLNIRPDHANFNTESKTWEISLKALVPSQVQLSDNVSKTFVYNFKNLGMVYVQTDDDGTFRIIEKPKALDIESDLLEKFADLTAKIEKEILNAGSKVWGELTYTRMWLRPFYTMIVNVLTRRRFLIDRLLPPENIRYIEMLVSSGYLEYADNDKRSVIPSNALTSIAESTYKKERYGEFEAAKTVVGTLFANHYNEIRKNFMIYVPTAYVDTTKAYYMDAVRVGESIGMTEDELWLKYRIIGHRQALRDKYFSFPTVVSEIVAGQLLRRDEKENLVADMDVLDRVLPYRDEIAQISLEI